MLIATFIVFYRLLSFSQTRFSPQVLLNSLYALMLIVITAQIITGESTVQQIVFTVMVYWLWHTCFKLVGKLSGEKSLKKRMRWMAVSGIGGSPVCVSVYISRSIFRWISGHAADSFVMKAFFVTGHACWVTDFYACDSLREIRRELGMPWAGLLELHGLYVLLACLESKKGLW